MEPGTIVHGCKIIGRLSQGGMGTVYRAVQQSVDREVVIKLLKQMWLDDDEFVKRFWQEAVAAAKLNHPNIVQIHDQGHHQGQPFIVMEYVPGTDVATLIHQQKTLSVPQVLEILIQTAAALGAAHDAGIVHRDIKPGNLLVTPEGQVKLTDFGIAMLFGEDATRLTQTDCLIGTMQYMAPELFDGSKPSPASDIYSLGITAYHMLAGERPFEGRNTLKLISKHMYDDPPPLQTHNPLVPEQLCGLIAKMIEKQPGDRFSNCRSLELNARKLQRLLGLAEADSAAAFTELSIIRLKTTKQARSLERRRRLLPWMVAGALLALSVVLGWWLSEKVG